MSSIHASSALIGLALASALNPCAAQPSFRALGTLTQPYPVSADATTVVGYYDALAFRWTEETGLITLGALPPPFDRTAIAIDVSGDGSVVVGAAYNLGDLGYPSWAFQWTESGGTVPMGPPPPDAPRSSGALDVSADGSVIIGQTFEGSYGNIAFRWTSEEGFELLGAGGASAVSADGNVLVINFGLAYRWTRDSGRISLGDLPGGYEFSAAGGISADGAVIVGRSASDRSSSWDGEAFRWTAQAGMVALGDLPGGFFLSDARATSADGSVIVGQGNGDGNVSYAFIWDQQRGMRRLQDVLAADYGLNLTGWRLFIATDITADGRTIVGGGVNPEGQVEGWFAYLGPCLGDFNRSSAINSQDFFDFLAAFFPGDPAADVNADGAVTAQDFFDFLGAFFAGCP
jgi:probable HAF family extracellular repeat protein